MNLPQAMLGKPERKNSELRVALVSAGLMIAIPLMAKLAARFGWATTGDFAERALLAILAGFIVLTGNTIPKRLAAPACLDADAASVQRFMRFAGWTWVLAGLAFGLSGILLPREAATTVTFIVMPLAITLIAVGWIRLYRARRPAA